MSDYKKRGRNFLILAAITLPLSIIFFCFEKTISLGIGLIISTAINMNSYFVQYRMTPEQFEQKQKQDKASFDERHMAIVYKTFRVTCIVMFLSLSAGFIFWGIFMENGMAMCATGSQLLIAVVSFFVASAFFERKM